MKFRHKKQDDGLKTHTTIGKARLIPAIFLMATVILFPLTEGFAASNKQVVILEVPDLEWSKISVNHPKLLNLLMTGSAGLVRLPATLTNRSLHFPIIRESYAKSGIGFYENLVSRIYAETDFNNTLLVVCSHRPPEIDNGLTPVLLKGAGFNGGVLYSPSTRKQGIVTYNDLRSTIIRFLDLGKTEAVFQIQPKPGDWRKLVKTGSNLNKNYTIRWPLLTGYFYLLLGVILLLLIGLTFRFRQRLIAGSAWGYLLLITAPAAFLLEALIDPVEWPLILFWTIGICGVLFLWSYFSSGKNITQALSLISLITAGLVVCDALLNGYYECKSFLGYSLVSGARYYGIGNEYMGILLGSSIVGLTLSFSGIKRWRGGILWLVALGIGLVLIHPNFGADVGGGITALMGLGVTNYLWLKQPIRFKEVTRLCLMTLAALVLAGAWDVYANRDCMSHLGQLLLAVSNHGPMVFSAMAIRKISLNLRLISSAPLSFILMGILLSIPFGYRFPPAPLQRLIDKHPKEIAGLTGLAITALIGFLVNDSGIVSAAMIFMFGIGLGLTVALEELNEKRGKKSQASKSI